MTQQKQRRITLIRHAKAEDDGVTQDHARALNARGLSDAAALGDWLRATPAALPGLVVCSTATRTRQTLEQLALGNVPVLLTDRAYLATEEELLALLQQMDDAVLHVGLIAHNPGLHQLAATLAGSYADRADEDRLLLKFPTSACAQLVFALPHWAELASQQGKLEILR